MVPPFHTSSKRSDNEVPKRKPIVLEFVTEFAPPSSFLFIPTQRADKLHLSVVIFDIKEKNIYIHVSPLANRTSKSSVRYRGEFLRCLVITLTFLSLFLLFFFFSSWRKGQSYEMRASLQPSWLEETGRFSRF